MSQVTQTAIRHTTGTELSSLKSPRSIILKLKKCAIERDITVQEVAIEAFQEYLARNKALYEKEIVITK